MKRKIIVLAMLFVIIVLLIAVLCTRHNKNEAKLENLINGDFDCLSDSNIKDALKGIFDQQLVETEWIYFDLNADGKMELVLQEKNCVENKTLKRIIGAFAIQDNEIIAVIWDIIDAGEFYFIGNDKLIYFYGYYGMYEQEVYQIYQFDSEWKKQFLEGFEHLYIYDLEELPSDWLEYHPTMTQEGTYYRKYKLVDMNGTLDWVYEDLSEQQWKDSLGLFLTACGSASDSTQYFTLGIEKYVILETNICNAAPKPVEENELLCQSLADVLEDGNTTAQLSDSFFVAEYFTYDLNADGKEDYLVSLYGAGYNGAHGNSTSIFLQEDDGLREVFHATMDFADSGENGGYAPVIVLDEKVNGLYCLVFTGYDRIWKYDEQKKWYVGEP